MTSEPSNVLVLPTCAKCGTVQAPVSYVSDGALVGVACPVCVEYTLEAMASEQRELVAAGVHPRIATARLLAKVSNGSR